MDRSSMNNNTKREGYPQLGFEQNQNPYSGLSSRYYSDNNAPLFLPHLNENKFGSNRLDIMNSNDNVQLRDIANSESTIQSKNNQQMNRDSSTSEKEFAKSTGDNDSDSEEEDEISTKKRKPRTKLTAEQKRNKKREIVKHSEQRRRVRLNERFEELKALLPGNREDINKLTKEMVLTEAVQFLKQLQANSHVTQQTTNSLEDPFNRMPLSKEEIEVGFNVIYSKELQQLTVVQSFGKLLATQESVNKVLELAVMSENELYLLYAYMLKNMFYSVVWCHPAEMLDCLDKAYGYYTKVRKSQDKPLIYLGLDIGVLIMVNYAHAFAIIGQFDKTMNCWQEANKIAKETKHGPSEASAYSSIRFLQFAKGDAITIEEAENIRILNQFNNQLRAVADFAIAVALIEAKSWKNETERRELVQHVNESLSASIKTFGSMADMSLRAMAIQALLLVDPDDALRMARVCVRRIEETSITGMWSKAEFLRLEAEALLSTLSASVEEVNVKEHEAKMLLREGIKIAVQENALSACLKCLVVLCKLFMKRGEMYEMNPFMRHLKSLADVISEACSQHSKLLAEAHALVDNFQRFYINIP